MKNKYPAKTGTHWPGDGAVEEWFPAFAGRTRICWQLRTRSWIKSQTPRPPARAFQTMVAMRDGTCLNTFVFLPAEGGPRFPVILHRTPYGIAAAGAPDKFDPARAWLPNPAEPMRGSILRGWRAIVARGYAAVYQDCRGRHGSEGEDRVYADDARDGHDTLEWIAAQPWTNQRVGMSGSSAGATTTFAAASTRHPSLRAFFAQAGGSSIYDDVVYEGQSIEMERLWLWVAKNIPGLSASHRAAVMRRFGIGADELDAAAERAAARYTRLDAARSAEPPFIGSPDWMHLPLAGTPDFATWQPFLDEIISHPAPDSFRARHNFRATIDIPGFHVTSWFDIFQTSVIAAFQEIQARTGTQKLWVGPNEHYFVYPENFLASRPISPNGSAIGSRTNQRGSSASSRCSIRRAPGSRTAPATFPTIGATPSAGRRRARCRCGSICAATAASTAPILTRTTPAASRAITLTTRAARSRPWAGATC